MLRRSKAPSGMIRAWIDCCGNARDLRIQRAIENRFDIGLRSGAKLTLDNPRSLPDRNPSLSPGPAGQEREQPAAVLGRLSSLARRSRTVSLYSASPFRKASFTGVYGRRRRTAGIALIERSRVRTAEKSYPSAYASSALIGVSRPHALCDPRDRFIPR